MGLSYRKGKWIDKQTGEEVTPPNKLDLSKPIRLVTQSDYEAYECPVTGKMIEGKAAHQENLKRTGCRILEPGEMEQAKRNGKKIREESVDKIVDAAFDNAVKEFDL